AGLEQNTETPVTTRTSVNCWWDIVCSVVLNRRHAVAGFARIQLFSAFGNPPAEFWRIQLRLPGYRSFHSSDSYCLASRWSSSSVTVLRKERPARSFAAFSGLRGATSLTS